MATEARLLAVYSRDFVDIKDAEGRAIIRGRKPPAAESINWNNKDDLAVVFIREGFEVRLQRAHFSGIKYAESQMHIVLCLGVGLLA